MQNFLKNLFYIGDSQRKSFIICGMLLLIYSLIRFLIAAHYSPPLPDVVFVRDSTLHLSSLSGHNDSAISSTAPADLNTASAERLAAAGIRPWIAKRIVKYRDAIDAFHDKGQLEKIYDINSSELHILNTSFYITKSATAVKNTAQTATDKNDWKLRPFNPNNCTQEELISMGFSAGLAKSIVNFRRSGFTYRSADDLARIYTMRTDILDRIRPYISIQEHNAERNLPVAGLSESKITEAKKSRIIDINQCSAEELDGIPGIGNYFANRIIRYREGLGGFIAKDQLIKLKILPDSTYQKALPYISIQTPARKIEINKVALSDLESVWYIGKQAYLIINYRTARGSINSFDEIAGIKGINIEKLKQVESYLDYSR